jgi:hypothetical protein
MYLTKGHNDLTKLNEITSCICGRFLKLDHHMALGRNFHIIKGLYLFLLYFQKLNTLDIKLLLGGDHSSFISTIS